MKKRQTLLTGLWLGICLCGTLALGTAAFADGSCQALQDLAISKGLHLTGESAFQTHLLNEPGVEVGYLTDIKEDPIGLAAQLPDIGEGAGPGERFQKLSQLPMGQIIIAPGHAFLSDGEKVNGLSQLIRNQPNVNFSHDPLVLNVITDSQGKPQYVDSWNGHNRLVAYMAAGIKKVGDIPAPNLTILVNGKPFNLNHWTHFLPVAGIDLKVAPAYTVHAHEPNTLIFSGKFSNYQLGSRTTLGALAENTLARLGPASKRTEPKIAVFFGTFDPIHEGHIETARKALQAYGIDEIVFIPNENPAHKPGATSFEDRLEMSAIRLEKEKGMNLYVKGTHAVISRFGNLPIMQRIGQIYGTSKLYMIEGTDAMQTLINLNQVDMKNYQYLVFPRNSADPFQVPAQYSNRIIFKPFKDVKELSSTALRNMIQSHQEPPADILDPREFQYIEEHHLYQRP